MLIFFYFNELEQSKKWIALLPKSLYLICDLKSWLLFLFIQGDLFDFVEFLSEFQELWKWIKNVAVARPSFDQTVKNRNPKEICDSRRLCISKPAGF
mmetsp:Transcript_18415/g.22539  ORF Transcript_18415/g.22539 Transcript_18415/m.22539 type:complete len:97 (-) Transcript_18415:587-877(-)